MAGLGERLQNSMPVPNHQAFDPAQNRGAFAEHDVDLTREINMPTMTILVLAVIVAAFVVFALVLAWTDRQANKFRLSAPTGASSVEAQRRRPF